ELEGSGPTVGRNSEDAFDKIHACPSSLLRRSLGDHTRVGSYDKDLPLIREATIWGLSGRDLPDARRIWLDQRPSASVACRIACQTAATSSRSVAIAPMETRTIQRPSTTAGVRYAVPERLTRSTQPSVCLSRASPDSPGGS